MMPGGHQKKKRKCNQDLNNYILETSLAQHACGLKMTRK